MMQLSWKDDIHRYDKHTVSLLEAALLPYEHSVGGSVGSVIIFSNRQENYTSIAPVGALVLFVNFVLIPSND